MTSQLDDQARIAARYPKRSLVDIAFAVCAGLAMLGAIGVVVYSGLVRSNPDVVAMVVRFDVTSAHLTKAEIRVQRTDPGKPAKCSLFAQAPSYEHVGEIDVAIPASTEKLVTVPVEIKTIKEATSVSIKGCQLAG